MYRCIICATVVACGLVSSSTPAAAQTGMSSLDSLLSIPIETAAKYEQTQGSAPASTVIVTSQEIDRFGYQTLGELLASLPGFYGSYDRN